MKEKRNPHRVIYTSSPDRGLQHALEMWPDIKKAVPDAEFHNFYGFQLFDKFYGNNPSSMSWKSRIMEMMKYDGITDHGRVPQPELAEFTKTCGLWMYPTHFGEINCISALKAQAYGAIPVVIDYAALETSVKYGVKVKGDIYDQETKDEYKKELIKALKDEKWQESVRKPMMAWASKKFTWAQIAKHWDAEFNGKSYEFWKEKK